MLQTIPIEATKRNLDSLLQQLHTGDTISLTSPDGQLVAVLVLVKSAPKMQASDWQVRWDALAKRISHSWQGDKSALEILREMRR